MQAIAVGKCHSYLKSQNPWTELLRFTYLIIWQIIQVSHSQSPSQSNSLFIPGVINTSRHYASQKMRSKLPYSIVKRNITRWIFDFFITDKMRKLKPLSFWAERKTENQCQRKSSPSAIDRLKLLHRLKLKLQLAKEYQQKGRSWIFQVLLSFRIIIQCLKK